MTPKHTIYLIASVILLCLLVGCASYNNSFYQVYETKLSDNINIDKDNIYYEDDNCKIIYDFWSNGGNAGFSFYNKTNKNIYLDLEESFFIKNGIAYSYFQKRTYKKVDKISADNNRKDLKTTYISSDVQLKNPTNNHIEKLIESNNGSKLSSFFFSNDYSVTYEELEVICIPPQTIRNINEYTINKSLYRSNNINQYPTEKTINHNNNFFFKWLMPDTTAQVERNITPLKSQNNKETFQQSQVSPLVFENIISYSLDRNADDLIRIKNSFYINSITNYREKEIIEEKEVEYYNEDKIKQRCFVDSVFAPNKFYIKYKSKFSFKNLF